MKKRWKTAGIIILASLFVLALFYKRNYELRFIDCETAKPITNHTILLVPRIIMSKARKGTKNPNLKYAKEIHTDSNGKYVLKATLLYELTRNGKVYVDSQSDNYARFTIAKIPQNNDNCFSITIFNPNSGIVQNTVKLVKGVNIIALKMKK